MQQLADAAVKSFLVGVMSGTWQAERTLERRVVFLKPLVKLLQKLASALVRAQ